MPGAMPSELIAHAGSVRFPAKKNLYPPNTHIKVLRRVKVLLIRIILTCGTGPAQSGTC